MAADIAIVFGKDTHFNLIDTKTAEAMINHIWCADGKNWSDRIWQNTDLLQQALNDNLIECVAAGKKPSELMYYLCENGACKTPVKSFSELEL